jgi:hypothetical protein
VFVIFLVCVHVLKGSVFDKDCAVCIRVNMHVCVSKET